MMAPLVRTARARLSTRAAPWSGSARSPTAASSWPPRWSRRDSGTTSATSARSSGAPRPP